MKQSPEQLLDTLWRRRAVAILRANDYQQCRDAMAAAVAGGFRVVEFTLDCPRPYDLIAEFAAMDDVVVGAGTTMTPESAGEALAAGASFIVSPILDDAVVEATLAGGAAMMPGVRTPTEMVRAHRLGCTTQKLFPAPADGPGFVRATLGPLPFLRLIPTSGVTPDNVAQFFDAGVYAVGFVAPLFPPQTLAAGDFADIERRARAALAATGAAPRPQ